MKKKSNDYSFAQDARRKKEIEEYGKLVSLRPSVCHKSKKNYDRRNFKKESSKMVGDSYRFAV